MNVFYRYLWHYKFLGSETTNTQGIVQVKRLVENMLVGFVKVVFMKEKVNMQALITRIQIEIWLAKTAL